jgi:hypothetical protein
MNQNERSERWREWVAGAALPSPVSAGSGSEGDFSIVLKGYWLLAIGYGLFRERSSQ